MAFSGISYVKDLTFDKFVVVFCNIEALYYSNMTTYYGNITVTLLQLYSKITLYQYNNITVPLQQHYNNIVDYFDNRTCTLYNNNNYTNNNCTIIIIIIPMPQFLSGFCLHFRKPQTDGALRRQPYNSLVATEESDFKIRNADIPFTSAF